MSMTDRFRLGTTALCTVLFGTILGMLFTANSSMRSPVRIEPQLVELVEQPVENQVAVASFTLVNDSAKPLLVKAAQGTCGCMKIETRGGALTSPRTVAPGEQLPWRVSINTQGRSGIDEQGLQLLCELDGKPLSVSTTIRMMIQPTGRIFPPLVQFEDVAPDSVATAEVGLYCGADLPWDSLAPLVISPHGEAAFKWLDEPTLKLLPLTIDVQGATAKRRRVLKIEMASGAFGHSAGARIELFEVGANSPSLRTVKSTGGRIFPHSPGGSTTIPKRGPCGWPSSRPTHHLIADSSTTMDHRNCSTAPSIPLGRFRASRLSGGWPSG